MPHAAAVEGEAIWLAHVVQQRRPAQHRIGRGGGHGGDGVRPQVAVVVRVALIQAEQRAQLRNGHGQHVGKRCQNRPGSRAAEQARQLGLHALGGDGLQQRSAAVHGGGGLLLHLHGEDGGKTQRPENAQCILVKAAVRLPHAADKAAGQIRLPAVEIHQTCLRAVSQGVHGKVPPGQVLLQRTGELHRVRMPVVAVCAVQAKGGDLQRRLVNHHGDGAVLQAGFNAAQVRKDLLDLPGQGTGGNVPVVGAAQAAHRVAHGAAHHIGLISGGVQPAQRGGDLLRQHHHSASPSFRENELNGRQTRRRKQWLQQRGKFAIVNITMTEQ